MMLLVTILWNLAWIAFFCAIHVIGHWAACKLARVHVEQVTLGWGPLLWSRFWGDTEYQLRLLPVAIRLNIAGLDEHPGGAKAAVDRGDRSFQAKNPILKYFVLLGGCLANLVIVVGALSLFHQLAGIQSTVCEIKEVKPDGPAALAGLQRGDRILKIDGIEVLSARETIEHINSSADKAMMLTIKRGDALLDIQVTPENREGRGIIAVITSAKELGERSYPTWDQALFLGFRDVFSLSESLVSGIGAMVRQAVFSRQPRDVGSPIGVVSPDDPPFKRLLALFLGIASVNLCIVLVSLLPIPRSPFDGGRILATAWADMMRGRGSPGRV